jgi:hypothetical protein
MRFKKPAAGAFFSVLIKYAMRQFFWQKVYFFR